MIHYNMVAGWMGFPYLSVNTGLTQTYTIGYKLKDKAGEHWTARFSRFKEKDRKAVWGAAYVFYDAVPDLMKHLAFNSGRVVFMPALSSVELKATPNRSICSIAKECARVCGTQYSDTALSKNAHQKIHSIYSAEGRSAELDKANYQCTPLNADQVFIFDDIVTRGDTLSRIAQAVLASNPKAKVYGIALAKSESVAFCPNPDNDQVLTKWDTLWKQGEQAHDAKFKKG